jgi:hypothetical protein
MSSLTISWFCFNFETNFCHFLGSIFCRFISKLSSVWCKIAIRKMCCLYGGQESEIYYVWTFYARKRLKYTDQSRMKRQVGPGQTIGLEKVVKWWHFLTVLHILYFTVLPMLARLKSQPFSHVWRRSMFSAQRKYTTYERKYTTYDTYLSWHVHLICQSKSVLFYSLRLIFSVHFFTHKIYCWRRKSYRLLPKDRKNFS